MHDVIDCALGRLLWFVSFHVIEGWVIDQVTLMMFVCSLVCLCLLTKCIKAEGQRRLFPIPLFPSLSHQHYPHYSTMSSPLPAYYSIPFTFREDGPAPDIVESMEEVGGPASLSLNWAYGIFFSGSSALHRS